MSRPLPARRAGAGQLEIRKTSEHDPRLDEYKEARQ
jgi:hypothetical protein